MAELFIKCDTDDVRGMYESHTFSYKGDSGLNLFFPRDQLIPGNSTVLVDLSISCEMKKYVTGFKLGNTELFVNTSYLMIPRSSIYKTPLRQANSIGLIDSKYRGNIKVAIDNIRSDPFTVRKGSSLFQVITPSLEQFNVVLTDKLSESDRNEGFGSSDRKSELTVDHSTPIYFDLKIE